MKRCALCLLLTLAMVSGLQAVQVVRIWPGYRTADSFESIGEFFGRPEFTGGRIVLRSKAEDRTGFYFLTRLRKAEASPGARIQVEVIFPGNDLARRFTLPVDLPAGGPVLNVGITGSDWPSDTTKPIAWRLSVLAANGSTLVSSQSFLWAQP